MEYSTKKIETIEKYQKPRSKLKFFAVLFLVFIFGSIVFYLYLTRKQNNITLQDPMYHKLVYDAQNRLSSNTPAPLSIPQQKTLLSNYHIFQTFNNCGPAALSMALRFYGVNVTQAEIGNSLRPYQVPGGDNDDKSVTLEELAQKSKEYNLIPYHRPMGNPDIVKQFIANGMPVIARTWTKPNEDIGHYRVVKGYDETAGTFIQDDSLQNKNLEFTYSDFNEIWRKFNYEYLVLVPAEKKELAEAILGENKDVKLAWQKAVENSLKELEENPNDIYSRFNLSVALFNVGIYKESAEEFEKVENQLPFRTLWYQIEPIRAYYELGNYERVFQITDRVLGYYNRAFSELYVLRGKIYQKQGNLTAARSEYQNAVYYNVNHPEANELLNSI